MRCRRCNRREGVAWATSPCGCSNAYCRECSATPEFQWWLAQYTKLHERVGGRYEGEYGPWPCPTVQGEHDSDFFLFLEESYSGGYGEGEL